MQTFHKTAVLKEIRVLRNQSTESTDLSHELQNGNVQRWMPMIQATFPMMLVVRITVCCTEKEAVLGNPKPFSELLLQSHVIRIISANFILMSQDSKNWNN